ncbi:hypothetical protein HHK36_007673 [Tetracentron sinense]|uniref:Mediator-associated protein 2 n=1 Tax=Tetracentron sinense TaxID=13715 RepID=A0A834ZTY7_TETSI|nr:hypothetical protein HHK36_007673 [Tetracentron sinense]
MDATSDEGYKPPPEFEEDAKDPLVDISLMDSSELWLIQWPINQAPDFNGQELSLKLHRDGQLGSFEGLSGKTYDVVSFAAQEPDATVFLSSASETKVVGKISRRVSLVHYPEPSELEKPNSNHLNRIYQRSIGTSYTNTSHIFSTPTRGIKQRSSHSASGMSHGITTSKNSSRKRSSLSEVGEPSKHHKQRGVDEPLVSLDQSTQNSGREGRSDVTSSGSFEHSHKRKSKRKI